MEVQDFPQIVDNTFTYYIGITLTPASYAVGDQPTQLEITITLPVVTASGETLTITPSATIFTGSAASDVTIDGASTMSGGPSIQTFSASAITVLPVLCCLDKSFFLGLLFTRAVPYAGPQGV